MTAIGNAYDEDTSEKTDAAGSWTEGATLLAANLTAGAKYVLMASCKISGSNASGHVHVHLTENGVEIADTLHIIEPVGGGVNNKHTYFLIHEHTTSDPATNIVLEFRQQTVGTAQATQFRLDALKVADLASGDYYRGVDATDAQLTTTMADHASITFTPDNNNDDWLIMATARIDIDSAAVNYEMRIRQDGTEASPTDDAPFMSDEGEDTVVETRIESLVRAYTLDNTSHTFAVQLRDDDAGVNDHLNSEIIAIRLNAFEDHNFIWTEADYTHTSAATYETMDSKTLTPTRQGDFLFVGNVICDTNVQGGSRFSKGGTVYPTNKDQYYDAYAFDLTSEPVSAELAKVNIATGETTIKLDGIISNTARNIEDRSLVWFSLELAAVTPTGINAGVMRRRVEGE